MTQAEELMLERYLPLSVTEGTAKGYAPGFKRWLAYLNTLDQKVHPGVYMEELPDELSRGKRLVLFMAYLFHEEGLRDEQIKKALTALSYQFGITGRSTTCFKLDIVLRGRRAGVRSNEEARALDVKRTKSMSLPICIEMVWKVRERYWEDKAWDAKGMDSRAIWLAVCLGFDSGPRIGNVTLKDGKDKEDHCMRARDATFSIVDPNTGKESRIRGGPVLAAYLEKPNVDVGSVKSVDLVYLTTKTSKKVKTAIKEPKLVKRGESVGETTVLDDVISWIRYSGVKETDEVLTRYNPVNGARKVVVRKDVAAAIKETAVLFDLPEENFTCKSLRSGFGTHVSANGMSDADMNKRGGWAKGSTVPRRHYVRDMANRGAFAMDTIEGGAQNHGLREIRRMLPAESGASNN